MALLTREQMADRSDEIKRQGGSVVFTNGCFDLIHRGHIELFRKAKSEGDYLFVAVNSDESVRKLKGDNRPILPEEDRAVIVDTFEMVDDVTIFHEDTPEELIRMIKPTVLVKGADYEVDEVVGAVDLKSWGGRMVLVPLVEGQGTRKIIEKVMTGYQAP